MIADSERLPVEPFLEWMTAQSRTLGGRGRLRDAMGISGQEFVALEALVPGDTVALSRVDRALTRFGEDSIWTLYPELDDDVDVEVVHCVRCREDVMALDDVCPWCETPILTIVGEMPERRPGSASSPRSRRKLLATVRRPRIGTGGWEPLPKPEPELRVHEPRERKRRRYASTLLTDEIAHEALWLYVYDGLGFLRCARRLLSRTPYRSERSLMNALYDRWRVEGWPTRDRVEATRLASYRHGLAPRQRTQLLGEKAEGNYRRWLKHERGDLNPRCRGTVKQGQRKGQRCLRPALDGNTHCQFHDPETVGASIAALVRARAVRDQRLVPAEPFAAYLEELVRELGTRTAVADAIGFSGTVVGKWIARRRPTVLRDTVDRALSALERDVTFEDLYAPLIRPAPSEAASAAAGPACRRAP